MSNVDEIYTPERRELILAEIDSQSSSFIPLDLATSNDVLIVLSREMSGYSSVAAGPGFNETLGEARDIGSRLHRRLKVTETLSPEMPPGVLASVLLNWLDFITQIPIEESVGGEDLVLFYIRRGYAPISRQRYAGGESFSFSSHAEAEETLLHALKEYLVEKPPLLDEFDRMSAYPKTQLCYNPVMAKDWCEKLGLTFYGIPQQIIDVAGFAPDPRL